MVANNTKRNMQLEAIKCNLIGAEAEQGTTYEKKSKIYKKLMKHLKQTREMLQIPLLPGQCWLNIVIYWRHVISR